MKHRPRKTARETINGYSILDCIQIYNDIYFIHSQTVGKIVVPKISKEKTFQIYLFGH